jgi:hypothetical protein
MIYSALMILLVTWALITTNVITAFFWYNLGYTHRNREESDVFRG